MFSGWSAREDNGRSGTARKARYIWRTAGCTGTSGRPGETPVAKPLRYPDYLKDPVPPEAMRHNSGHGGSQIFLSAEFVNSLLEDREPAIDVHKALAITVPGIVGHQSAMKKGERRRFRSLIALEV
jgi:hypothetical protein